jgi:hypothetical protein
MMMKKIWSFPGRLLMEVYPKETDAVVFTFGKENEKSRATRAQAANLIWEYRKACRMQDEMRRNRENSM